MARSLLRLPEWSCGRGSARDITQIAAPGCSIFVKFSKTKGANLFAIERQFFDAESIIRGYGKQVLACSRIAGIKSTVLTKANLPKGRDAKLPV
jgi:hypothetical protein